jgi:hypothetical protein
MNVGLSFWIFILPALYLDDTLRRASAQRVAAAALGAGLVTLAAIYASMASSLHTVCAAQHPGRSGLLTGLSAAFGLAAVTAVIAVPSSRRQFEPVRTLPDGSGV